MPRLSLMEMGEDDLPEAMTIEISEEEVSSLNVGQKVEVTIRGSVGMLQVPPGGTKEGPPLMGVRVSDKRVRGRNAFADLAEDEDEEE